MNEISITLNEKYKSFEPGFTTVLEGELIILSGVNGSGKSQLMNVIYGKGTKNPANNTKPRIDSLILLNGRQLTFRNVEFKSYKDNINVPEIIKSSSAIISRSAEQAWSSYKQNSLIPPSITQGAQFRDASANAIKLLGSLYQPHKKDIPEDDFKRILMDNNFMWTQDDAFADTIGNLFYSHAIAIADGQQSAGKIDGPAFDPMTLGLAPWTELNNLFEVLKLDYRFKNDIQVKSAELTERPKIFQIDSEGTIIEEESRDLKDLSDGEKTILSLCFTSMQNKTSEDINLLLLDEYDAVLNPSLIDSFFLVLERYFLKKGITVILTTHSPATIALSPEYTSFYEVFKSNISRHRIIKVERDNYIELQKVNKKFYDKISDQAMRIKMLESTILSDSEITIITEGKTDWKYFLKALQYFHNCGEYLNILEDYFYKYGTKEDVENSVCGTRVIASFGDEELKSNISHEVRHRSINLQSREKMRIYIFDSDNQNIKLSDRSEYGLFAFKILPEGTSTEFLFYDDVLKSKVSNERLYIGSEFDQRTYKHNSETLNLGSGSSKKAGKEVIIDTDVYGDYGNVALSKEKFAQSIYNGDIEVPEENWNNFRHVFEKIVEYIDIHQQLSKRNN